MFQSEEKIEMFFSKDLWEKAVQHCIDKGIKPVELNIFTTAGFRARLYEDMLAGKYKVAPPHIALIPKEDKNEFRKVYVNTVLDRLVLTIINEVYSNMYGHLIHPKCVSYRKGIGVKNIVRQISKELVQHDSNMCCGYKIDISKYFDSVSRETMNNVLKSVSTGSCLDQILYDYYNDDVIMDEDGNLVEHYKSLCQGCAPSAFFANLTLREVDDVMDGMCDIYYRYSDDLLMIGRNSDKALEKLQDILAKKGLKVNPKKVKPIYPGEWFEFLGCKIKGNNISLNRKSLDNFVSEMKDRTRYPKDKKHRKGCSEVELKRMIRSINRYLYTGYIKNSSVFGWGEYFFSIINCEKDIETMDTWLKDWLRGCATGNTKGWQIGGLGNVNTEKDYVVNRGKGSNIWGNYGKTDKLLERCGYVSMHHLWKAYKTDHDVYESEIYQLMMK